MNRRTLSLVAALIALPLAVACGDSGDTGSTASSEPAPQTITLLTYDSFTEPEVLKDFTARTGITVRVAKAGDAGTLVNKAILTKGNPEGDVLWGLDNTLLSRALGEKGLFVPYESPELGSLDPATGERIADLFLRTQESARVALVVVTHNPGLARRLHRTYRLADGRLVD